jgi:spermidine synthase
LLLFAGSGCAALLYEVVWFHLLRLVVGSSSVSLAFLLGSFMGGMCLGSLLLPRLVGTLRHPLRVYALLELGIGASGLVLPRVLPWLADLYTGHAASGVSGFVLRGAVCGAALLPPTMLMGATLPAIARWLDGTQTGLSRLGLFYGANIAGAVLGTVLAGFWLLPEYDVAVATWVAVAINVSVALVALLLSLWHGFAPAASPADGPAGNTAPRAFLVYVAIALSGCTALGAEVVWTRLLSLLFGATVYTFTLILAVFLVGLGIGSALGSRWTRRSSRPALLFGVCQLLLVPAFAYSALIITTVLPYGEPTWLFQERVYQNVAVHWVWDIARCAVAILPATILWGASFPLALAAAGGRTDPGRLVSGVYAANTVGAIAGAILTGLTFIVTFGSQRTQQILALLAGLAAFLLLVFRPAATGVVRLLGAVVVLLLAPIFTWLVARTPDDLLTFGRTRDDWGTAEKFLYTAEGLNASVAIIDRYGARQFHVNGKVEASTILTDMRLQRLLGHLPALVHTGPRSVLVVGCGAAVTAGCFVDHPSVDRIVICELEPVVVTGTRRFMAEPNHGVLDDPRTTVVIDDARHFLATTTEKFDIITSDPVHPWVRGAATLYSSEYYELVQRHLNPGGVVTQWVPLYETDEASVKSQIGTFALAFPTATLWSSDQTGEGYDLVAMAQHGNPGIDVDDVQRRIAACREVASALAEVQLGDAVALLRTYAGRVRDLQTWLADAQINRDASLRLQYLAGRRPDLYREKVIYGAIKTHRRYPVDLFAASPGTEQELRQALAR